MHTFYIFEWRAYPFYSLDLIKYTRVRWEGTLERKCSYHPRRNFNLQLTNGLILAVAAVGVMWLDRTRIKTDLTQIFPMSEHLRTKISLYESSRSDLNNPQ